MLKTSSSSTQSTLQSLSLSFRLELIPPSRGSSFRVLLHLFLSSASSFFSFSVFRSSCILSLHLFFCRPLYTAPPIDHRIHDSFNAAAILPPHHMTIPTHPCLSHLVRNTYHSQHFSNILVSSPIPQSYS